MQYWFSGCGNDIFIYIDYEIQPNPKCVCSRASGSNSKMHLLEENLRETSESQHSEITEEQKQRKNRKCCAMKNFFRKKNKTEQS